ncbi:hypothetical protein ACFVBP_10310, partial [Nocardioides sp. NPDC057764]|uniref:hypothetical protein n=1 Tax=Nocardioides sp. NPDC057764 TaxID=3346243 RepID=UPI00366E2F6D
MRYIPDEHLPAYDLRDLVEKITGRRCPWGGAAASYVIAAWCRSTLNRWALKQPGVWEARRSAADRQVARDLGIGPPAGSWMASAAERRTGPAAAGPAGPPERGALRSG